MLKLSSPVYTVPKIGPQYTKLLKNLNIETVEDLLFHIPFRYDDYSKIVPINQLQEKELATIEAIIGKADNIYTKYGKRLTKARVIDHTGELDLIWFNQQYVKKQLKVGKKYYFSGKPQIFNSRLTLVAPTFEEAGEGAVSTARLVPVYSATYGITPKWLRVRINDVLKIMHGGSELDDILPEKIIKKYKLMGFEDALNEIHFPPDEKHIEPAKKRLAFEELLMEMLKVEERKFAWHQTYEGVHLEARKHEDSLYRFINSLPFRLTGAQERSVEEILGDLDTPNPMNRLLEGDVGSGKTIVAIVAAYLAHLCGFKTLYMAPTDILAKQHHETFKKFLDGIGVEVKLRTSTNKRTDITSSTDDIVVGTHALLHEKDGYKNVGLIIIDEQHRFGVEQRGKITEMGTGDKVPNLLTMTATPIPRTLALTLYGDLDISVLDEVPNVDKEISTKVIPEKHREKIYEWIREKKEPAFIVCPLIGESESDVLENVRAAEKEYETLRNGVFAHTKIDLLHGRMRAKEKHAVIDKFRAGETDVLVSTPVIEVGVDIPEATIMVIESAERYGLASLHQLRGRVGRGAKKGYCFVFMSNYSKRGYARLKNLENIDSGLKLAEIDLKYRGQGDIFGTMQHGFKDFKVANLDDLEMLETTKNEAEGIFKDFDSYPRLKQRVKQKTQYVIQN